MTIALQRDGAQSQPRTRHSAVRGVVPMLLFREACMQNTSPKRGTAQRARARAQRRGTPRPQTGSATDAIEVRGRVAEVLPHGFFRVHLENEHVVLAHL